MDGAMPCVVLLFGHRYYTNSNLYMLFIFMFLIIFSRLNLSKNYQNVHVPCRLKQCKRYDTWLYDIETLIDRHGHYINISLCIVSVCR